MDCHLTSSVAGFESFWVDFAPVPIWDFSGYSRFLSQHQVITFRLIGDSKLAFGVNVCVGDGLSHCVNPGINPGAQPLSAGIDLSSSDDG